MEWVWELYKSFVYKRLAREGNDDPSDEVVQHTFMKTLSASTLTVLVQEPWQNSVRFKELARYDWDAMRPVIDDPMNFLLDNFGGGKFKFNFHEGWNFIATQNFKPEGDPRWKDM